MTDYNKQSIDFLNATNTKFKAVLIGYGTYFSGDMEKRNIYKVTLKNDKHSYSFKFGASIADGKCSEYDVLSCLQKYEIGSFNDFIAEFGYETTPEYKYYEAKRTYKAVCKEYANVRMLFTEKEMESLQEIN